jgi:hypothetical protein
MHLFERARLIGGAGMVVTAHLDPTHLSPQMRKSVAKQIREGIYLGWSSKAADAAKKYLAHFNGNLLPACGIAWGTLLQVNRQFVYTPEMFDEIRRMLQASAAIYKMQTNGWRSEESIDQEVIRDIRMLKCQAEEEWTYKRLSTYQKEIAQELAKYLSESRTDEQKKHAAWIADKVMEDKRIPVIF